jgi:hypothetical protein
MQSKNQTKAPSRMPKFLVPVLCVVAFFVAASLFLHHAGDVGYALGAIAAHFVR